MRSFLLIVVVACSSPAKPVGHPVEKPASLYDRLGGDAGVHALIDAFVATLSADDRINTFFKNTDAVQMKKLLNEQVCVVTGGPCTYTGKDMKTVHTGMGVHGEHFDALIEDFTKALVAVGVHEPEQRELLGKLQALRSEVVAPSAQ